MKTKRYKPKRERRRGNKTQGSKVGRPMLTIADLPVDWEERMIKIAKGGGSAVSARAALNISLDLWTRFIAEDEEFSIIVKRCHQLCEDWWERQGQKMTLTGKGSATVWKFNMQNRFGWTTKVDLGNKDNKPFKQTGEMTDDELAAELEARGLKGILED